MVVISLLLAVLYTVPATKRYGIRGYSTSKNGNQNMKSHTIYIKHMCCRRCIDAVENILTSLHLKPTSIRLGQATFRGIDYPQETLFKMLREKGFEIVTSEEERTTEQIKAGIIELIHSPDELSERRIKNIREYLEHSTAKPYRQLNTQFMKQTGVTIARYIILQKIERVKMLIDENRLNFSEIADATGYNTLQHLSGQFKKVTGISMQMYKTEGHLLRNPIDKI